MFKYAVKNEFESFLNTRLQKKVEEFKLTREPSDQFKFANIVANGKANVKIADI